MLFGWSTRSTAESAVFTNRCPLPGSGFARLNTPLAAHAYMMRSIYLASLPTLAAISAADSGPSAAITSGILNFCATCTRIVW